MLPPGGNRLIKTYRGHSLLVEDEDVDVHGVEENHEQIKEFEVRNQDRGLDSGPIKVRRMGCSGAPRRTMACQRGFNFHFS